MNVPFLEQFLDLSLDFPIFWKMEMVDATLGRGVRGVKLVKWLTQKCRGILVGEEKISLYSSKTLYPCFYYVDDPYVEAMDVLGG